MIEYFTSFVLSSAILFTLTYNHMLITIAYNSNSSHVRAKKWRYIPKKWRDIKKSGATLKKLALH